MGKGIVPKREIQRGGEILLSRRTLSLRDADSKAVAKIEASSNTTISVPYLMDMLEGRADVRAQMGRIEDALEDGNRMLKVDNANPRVRAFLTKTH